MNPNYTADLKLVQRYILDQSLYLLTMFEKKIDTFTGESCVFSKRQKQMRKEDYQNQRNFLDQNIFENPYSKIEKDQTKPFWNCLTMIEPSIIFPKQRNTEPVTSIAKFHQIFNSFINRYKNEQEDESNLRIHLKSYLDSQKQLQKIHKTNINQIHEAYKKIEINTDNFLNLLKHFAQKQFPSENSEVQPQYLRNTLNGLKELCEIYIKKEDESFHQQINIFNYILTSNFNELLDGKIGSLVVCLQPKLKHLPLLIHPMLISLYTLTKNQLSDLRRKEEKKNERKGSEKRNGESLSMEEESYVFEDLKFENCSRMVFINFDGYESECNIDIAKYLSKNLMYISFPRESLEREMKKKIDEYEMWKSERMLRKYYHHGITAQQKQELMNLYENSQKQVKKNLFVFPINCKFLNEKYDFSSIEYFESYFIAFIMKEILLNPILEFNPSCIVVSYSQKLNIEKNVFVQLMKELTKISNYRIVFYANMSKSYLFEEYLQLEKGKQFYELERSYFEEYEKSIKVFQQENNFNNLNLDLFEKIGIVTKIISGTYNLNKNVDADPYIEKYRNSKVMDYASKLLKVLEPELPSLEHLKSKLNEYSIISRVLKNYFLKSSETFEKIFVQILTRYHKNTIRTVQTLIMKENIEGVEKDLNDMREQINKRYGKKHKKEVWQNLKFNYLLEISTDKVQSKYYAHIPKYKGRKEKAKKSAENLISLEFEISSQKQKRVEFTSATKIYHETSRKHPNALIYLINYIHKSSATQYHSFCGVIDRNLEQKPQYKIPLYPVSFNGVTLNEFQSYTEFNYLQTDNYIFMFWPKIFNVVKYLMNRMLNQQYVPQCSKLFFCAHRDKPTIFNAVEVMNPQYKQIIPRFGCKCYEVGSTGISYVFGGFYSNKNDYLAFQTDITKIDMNKGIKIENVPKNFHFDYEPNHMKGTKNLTKIKQDFIRPRIQYQILQHDSQEGSIFIIGGIGSNFQRPYSIIGHMAHKVSFCMKTGNLLAIQRIKMNNIVPVNVQGPLKIRQPSEMQIIRDSKNRKFFVSQGKTTLNSVTISHHNVTYDEEEEKFSYETEYSFADLELLSYRNEMSILKKNAPQVETKIDYITQIRHGKQFGNNVLLIKIDEPKYYELYLQLSIEVREFEESSFVKLPEKHVKSIDINANRYLYAIVNHPKYTMGENILTFFDVHNFLTKGKSNIGPDGSKIILNEIYKFEKNVSTNKIIVANPNTIAILHGHKFEEQVEVPEMIIRLNRKGAVAKVTEVRQCEQLSKELVSMSKFQNGLNCSFFLNQNNGKFLCVSLKSTDRNPAGELVYLLFERLNLNDVSGEYCRWTKVTERYLNFKIYEPTWMNKKSEQIKIIQINEQTQQKNSHYEVILVMKKECFRGYIDLSKEKDIEFASLHQSEEEYMKETYKDLKKKYPIKIQKNHNAYDDLRTEFMND